MTKLSSVFGFDMLSNSITTHIKSIPNAREVISEFTEAHQHRIITLEEASCHDSAKDCWIIVYDRVYDVTNFLEEHPGGSDILLDYAGREATVAFRGSGHSARAIRELDKFLVGELPMHERIFRKPGGFRLSDLPK